MSDELALFRRAERDQGTERTQIQVDVLVVEQGEVSLGILASSVDSVIPWRVPNAVPLCSDEVLGIVQDRGRLVTVQRYRAGEERPKRLVVCMTRLGLVGIAATATRHVGTVTVEGSLQVGIPLQTSAGALTLVDPEDIARAMTGQAGLGRAPRET